MATTRTNLVKNPSFEVDLTGWSKQGTTVLTRDTTVAYSGSASMKVVANTTERRFVWGATGSAGSNADSVAVTAGQSVTYSYYVYPVSGSLAFRPKIHWFNSSGGWIQDSDLQPGAVTLTAGSWQRVSITATAPAGAGKFGISESGGIATFYVDGFLVEISSALGSYFDGSTPASGGFSYSWSGTPNASTSLESDTPAPQTLSSAVSASGTVSTALSASQNLAVPVSASGTVTTALSAKQSLAAPVSAGVTVTTALVQGGSLSAAVAPDITVTTALSTTTTLSPAVSAGVTVSTALAVTSASISPSVSAGVTVSTTVVKEGGIRVDVSPRVNVLTRLVPNPRRSVSVGTEVVVLTELQYEIPPAPLGTQALGKLADFSVSTSAVPLNPAEGSGGVPTVTGTFIAGERPRSVLGQAVEVRHDAIGTWKGKAVHVTTGSGEKVPVTIETPLSKLGSDLRLFPVMPPAASVDTAMQAIDYWTQQAGMPYDAIDGDLLFYQSAYGHPYAYGRGVSKVKLIEQGSATTASVGGRLVRSFGGTTKAWDTPDARVPVTVQGSSVLVLQTGAQLPSSGTSTVTFVFDDVAKTQYPVVLSFTATGVSATVNGAAPVSVVASGTVRAVLSLYPVSDTAWAVKLTAGGASSGSRTVFTAMPAGLRLREVRYEGTSGTRWGTAVSLAGGHPRVEAQPQKSLTPTDAALEFVSGFEGNVWDRLIEFCAINRIDLGWEDSTLVARPRETGFVSPEHFGQWEVTDSIADRFREVTVVDKRSQKVTDRVLYRADSVYTVARGEVFETTVQTDHSILSVKNPVCVTGIEPFPYKNGTGQFVVTGADGYIVSPQFWADYGGKVEAFITEKEGEIRLKITAPHIEATNRSPYRISEGAGDRPALYICGEGIFNEPEEVTVDFGDTSAREGHDSVFESPFLTGRDAVYETIGRIAEAQASQTEATFEMPVEELGQFPAGKLFADGDTVWRVLHAEQDRAHVRGTAIPAMTLDMYAKSYPDGSTISDEYARFGSTTYDAYAQAPLKEQTP